MRPPCAGRPDRSAGSSRSMRPSAANVHVLVPRLRPAVQPLPSQSAREHAVAPGAGARSARRRRRGGARAACRPDAGAGRRPARARRRGEVGGRRGAPGRAEGALEGAHERLGIGEVDCRAVGQGQLAAVGWAGSTAARSGPAAVQPRRGSERSRLARAASRSALGGSETQSASQASSGQPVAVTGVAARDHQRHPAAVGVPVGPRRTRSASWASAPAARRAPASASPRAHS